jgi:mono/diheme cytochrome c family protein
MTWQLGFSASTRRKSSGCHPPESFSCQQILEIPGAAPFLPRFAPVVEISHRIMNLSTLPGATRRSAAPHNCAVWLLALLLTAPLLRPLPVMAAEPQAKPESSKPESTRPFPAKDDAPRFETHIAPIFRDHCVKCHNADTTKAELDLSSVQGVFKGSESGVIIEPGKLDESLLWDMVHEGFMPPEGEGVKPLSEQQLAVIRTWIESGAPLVAKASPDEIASAEEITNLDIEPLMMLRCATCHGLRKQEAGLDLRTKASMLAGGESGPAILPGKPEESLVVQRIHAGEMPPKDQLIRAGVRPMESIELESLKKWIAAGAPEVPAVPDVATTEPDPLVTDEDRQHWAFQPPREVTPPKITSPRVRNSIDAFVLKRLREAGLDFAPEADKRTLMRRAYFDLTGLPPTPEEAERFLSDEDPLAYEHLIDRLLDSPHYGERWGRFWLDAAGYADSEGKRSADPLRPYAFKYRDYVIRAFNSDKPYDRFLLEQIAGDELADYASAEVLTQEMVDNLTATGFLRMAPDGTGSDIVNTVVERLEVINDEIDIFSSTVLGLTMKCARCHSHKYDPLPQRDYYRLAAVFKGAFDEHDWLKPASVPGQTKNDDGRRFLACATPDEMESIEEQNRRIEEEIKHLNEELERTADEFRARHLRQQLSMLPEELRDELRAMLKTPAEERTERQKELAKQYEDQLTLDDKELKKADGYSRAKTEIDRQVKSLEKEKAGGPLIRALWDRGEPSPSYIYRRGEFNQPGRLVGPGVPSVLTDGRTPFEVKPPWPGAKKTGRRLALARWLIEPDNPLTSRVMVNRIWKHHFGEGIVRSLDNFGKLGTPPTHPDLLDWLAREFIARGWSMKSMHRLMMTSSTYRQSSLVSRKADRLDPENELLSRMPLRRMDAEEVRDTLIFVAGRMNEEQFGRPDPVSVRGDGLVTSVADDGMWRRSIYLKQRRKEIATVLETFDLPQMNPNCRDRVESTVAQQALYLMNNAMVRELADAFADRVAAETLDPLAQIDRAYQFALSRAPTDEERAVASETLNELAAEWVKQLKQEKKSTDDANQRALATFCHTLMNSAEFIYID